MAEQPLPAAVINPETGGLSTNTIFAPCLERMGEPSRYKIFYGGRGSGKSWSIARYLLLKAISFNCRILCAREIQDSIDDSVYLLLEDQAKAMGISGYFKFLRDEIECLTTGSSFIFSGLRHKIDSLKSAEGIDYCWVEEAQMVSKSSWNKLIPTVRKDGSEIWVSFNPELETDETYVRFVRFPQPGSILFHMNYENNPWFPKVLNEEMEALRQRSEVDFRHIYGGECRQAVTGAVYGEELRSAQLENRITDVPYERGMPVRTFWDLGRADKTSIWFAQRVGFQYRFLDFYEADHQHLSHFLKVVADRGYTYDFHCLPHDAEFELLGQIKSIAGQARDFFGEGKVKIVPKLDVVQGINAARTIFPSCWFDVRKCDDGVQHLRRYRYEYNEKTGRTSPLPLHDEHSHSSDAFRYASVMFRELGPKRSKQEVTPRPVFETSWMS